MNTIRRVRNVVLAVAGSVCLVASSESQAQVARYTPATPTVSPYLNLTRFDNGGLPNYYSLVRPLIRQRDFNLQTQAIEQRQQREIVRLENEVVRGQELQSATGTGSWFLVPSNRTSYMNTSRYFPEPNIRGAGR